MKNLLLSLLLFFSTTVSFSQTATNFTAPDCSNNSHTLFSELDNGKVVVLVWIMPCGACIGGAKAAYDQTQTFATSNPGKVIYYLSDDAGNTSCATLATWASTNSVGPDNMTIFGNATSKISEANYGGAGMPHVVVMGGTDHKIYFNKLNGASADPTGIKNAITDAIAASTSTEDVFASFSELKVFPNPVKDKMTLSFTLTRPAELSIDMVNLLGARVKTWSPQKFSAGNGKMEWVLENNTANGIYFLRLTADGVSRVIKIVVSN